MKVIKMGRAIEPYCEKECPKCHAVIGIDGTDFDRIYGKRQNYRESAAG